MSGTTPSRDALPAWRRVLAVVAHPDDESFGLGGLLDTVHDAGTESTVLCFTHGEASTLRGVPSDLHEVRAAELRAAALLLGVAHVDLRDHPDGHLAAVATEVLASEVAAVAEAGRVDGILVFDTGGVTGHPDHTAATLRRCARLGRSTCPCSAGSPRRSTPNSVPASAAASRAGST
jgi:N-acetylglucosamine malate deacetylase 2